MSLKCIDKGVVRKLKEVYPNVVFGPLSRALEIDADTVVNYDKGGLVVTSDPYDYEVLDIDNENKTAAGEHTAQYGTDRTSKNCVVAFPLIACDRLSNKFRFGDAANDPLIRRGWRMYNNRDIRSEEEEKAYSRERAFPVDPIYQIDIISNRRFEVDEIWRELCMYLYLSPNISVIYSEGTEEEFEEKYPLLMIDTDNTTDVETFTEKGIIYRQTITAQLKDAELLFHKDVPLIERIPIHVEPFNEDWLVEKEADNG